MKPEKNLPEPLDAADGSVLNVLVAYEDFGSRLRAELLIKRVMQRCGLEDRLKCAMWPFDALALPSKRTRAARQAEASDIILVVAQDGAALPRPVSDWLKRGVARAHHRARCLGAFLQRDRGEGVVLDGITEQLRNVAAMADMAFFGTTESCAVLTHDPGTQRTVPEPAVSSKSTTRHRQGLGKNSSDGAGNTYRKRRQQVGEELHQRVPRANTDDALTPGPAGRPARSM